MAHSAHSGSQQSDRTREKILRAAIRTFSQHGLAGARTDAIAEAAGVNKALLYYYFKSKNGLYTAALEEVSGKAMNSAVTALEMGRTPGESLLRLILNHFDRILAQREFQSLMQQEMVRFHRGETAALHMITHSVFAPLLAKMQEVIRQGIHAEELWDMDWLQILYAGFGANVFYFLSAPMMRLILPFDPLDAGILKTRRRLAIEYVALSLFRDKRHGANVAKRVLATTPIPKIKRLSIHRRCS